MEISEEIIDQVAGEVLKEIEEEAKAAGRKITFDDLENGASGFQVGKTMV
jgi:hypothetical protein